MKIQFFAIFAVLAVLADPTAAKAPKARSLPPPPPHVWQEDPRPDLLRRMDGSTSVKDVVQALGLPDVLDTLMPTNTSEGYSDAKFHRPPGRSLITAQDFFTDDVKRNLISEAIQELPALFFLDRPVALLKEIGSSILLQHFLYTNVSLAQADDENQVEFAHAYLVWLFDSNEARAHFFLVKLDQPRTGAEETPLITPRLIQNFTRQVLPDLAAAIGSPYRLNLTNFADVLVLPFARLYLAVADLTVLNCRGDLADRIPPDYPQPALVAQRASCEPVITFPRVTVEATMSSETEVGQLKYQDMKPSEEFFDNEAPVKLKRDHVHPTSRVLFESFLPQMEKHFSAQTYMTIGSELGNHTHVRYPHRSLGPRYFVGEFWIGVTSCVAGPGSFRRAFNETQACPLMFKFPGVALAGEVGKELDDPADKPADGISLYEVAIALRMIKFDPFELGRHF